MSTAKRRTKRQHSEPAPAARRLPWRYFALLAVAGVTSYLLSRHFLNKPQSPPDGAATAQSTADDRRDLAFRPTKSQRADSSKAAPAGMVWVPGGEFSMGCADPRGLPHGGPDPMNDCRPIHRVALRGFWMDRTEVTNRQFERFTRDTGYRTVAERTPKAEDFPGAPPENLVAGSVVFTPPAGPVPLDNHYQWWAYVKGADWRHPEGPDSNISKREQHPVVHIAFEDAAAYARWAGKRLPTEAEWEFAARGGLAGNTYAWGNELRPAGRWMANVWQGDFPISDTGDDGHRGIAPAASYAANRYGLYDMAGNVWEWCSDWYRPDYYKTVAAAGVARNPQGPSSSFDPLEPDQAKRVQRGGSYLCAETYCTRYMIGTRGKGEVSSASNHLGFRCVKSAGAPAGD